MQDATIISMGPLDPENEDGSEDVAKKNSLYHLNGYCSLSSGGE
jgi:hypothetical protein